jgi:hypothetical protein
MEFTAENIETIFRKLDTIEQQTEELRAALPVELADWQEQDMRRQRATTRTIDVERPAANFTRAGTVIHPTSRRRVQMRRRAIRKLKKAGQHARIIVSKRPTLRPALVRRFQDRFVTLLLRNYT